jgi:hypothetical protein
MAIWVLKRNNMYKYLFLICLVLGTSCSGKNKKVNKESISQSETLSRTSDTLNYSLRNDSIVQNVKVFFVSNNQIYFHISSNDLKDNRNYHVDGHANKIENATGTSDTGEENGFTYFVDDFEVKLENYSGLIFIEQKNFNRLTFYFDSKDQMTKIVSFGVLKLL